MIPFLTHCFLFDRNDFSIVLDPVPNPYFAIISRKISREIELNAFAKY